MSQFFLSAVRNTLYFESEKKSTTTFAPKRKVNATISHGSIAPAETNTG